MTSVLVLWVCLSSGQQCQPMIGEEMQHVACLTTGKSRPRTSSARIRRYRLKKYACVEPRRVRAILGRTVA